MKKLILTVIIVLIAAAAWAEEAGTYKLVLGSNRSDVYKINTKTGQSWVSTQIVISDVNQLTYYWGPMTPDETRKWETALKINDGKAVIRIWQSLDDKGLFPLQ